MEIQSQPPQGGEAPPHALPGSNLMTRKAYAERMAFIQSVASQLPAHLAGKLRMDQVINNIESFVGSIEVPVALIGPLRMRGLAGADTGTADEWVFGLAATTEGALIASMNRGARAIAANGVEATVIDQSMVRAPMFSFANHDQAASFQDWIKSQFDSIRREAEAASNHAQLLALEDICLDESVHIRFRYRTGDASGQNMSTACTWHACQWILERVKERSDWQLVQFGIEGNGSSDKKVSRYAMENGRGTRVVARTDMSFEEIRRILRVDPELLFDSYDRTRKIAAHDGMVGFNINVANAVAALFLSTGQDMACVAESASSWLSLKKENDRLYFELELYNLVIGSVGGGTSLPGQRAILDFMGCQGHGSAERLAKIIAGFALALEMSTFSAVVGGQFARAHEAYGRNKPRQWVTRAEVDQRFITAMLSEPVRVRVEQIDRAETVLMDNGILTDLSTKVTRKMIGFMPLVVTFDDGSKHKVLLKSKALDSEIINGMQYMASHVASDLADEMKHHLPHLEYRNCHRKEVEVMQFLHDAGFTAMPAVWGAAINTEREFFAILEEYLDPASLRLYNSELQPELWQKDDIARVSQAILDFQSIPLDPALGLEPLKTGSARPLFEHLVTACRREVEALATEPFWDELELWMKSIPSDVIWRVLSHGDFNPRNIAVRTDERIAIYDWELANLNVPQRDWVEFLVFVLHDGRSDEEVQHILASHERGVAERFPEKYDRGQWSKGMRDALCQFAAGRLTFYLLGESMLQYGFSHRVFRSTQRLWFLLQGL